MIKMGCSRLIPRRKVVRPFLMPQETFKLHRRCGIGIHIIHNATYSIQHFKYSIDFPPEGFPGKKYPIGEEKYRQPANETISLTRQR
jgi:hypothetical protein